MFLLKRTQHKLALDFQQRENKDYNKAMKYYNNVVKAEKELSEIFKEEKEKTKHSIMKLYIDLAKTHSSMINDEKVINMNKRICDILNEIGKAGQEQSKKKLLAEVLGLYKDIPPELFEHKRKINRHLIEAYAERS